MEPIRLEKIAGDDNCRNGDCPMVYRTNRGTIAVQGERLAHPTPDHEATVVKLLYREDGTQVGRELVEHPDLGAYLAWRGTAWEHGIPYTDYHQD